MIVMDNKFSHNIYERRIIMSIEKFHIQVPDEVLDDLKLQARACSLA